MSNTAYIAIDYICNQKCEFCPCSKNEKKLGMITPFLELKASIDNFAQSGIKKIVISGGEPTLHPQLSDIIFYAQQLDMQVVLLSNSERFSNEQFLHQFVNAVKISELTVITTLHSHIAQEHEMANQTPGSFNKTVNGLKGLCDAGATIIIKHCLTVHNYLTLTEFYQYIDQEFTESVSIQLCSIDYCGIPQNLLEQEKLSFLELKPHLEKLFDYYIERLKQDSKRNLYCINIPLCSCDVYYWNFIRHQARKVYEAYKDPHYSEVTDVNNNVGTFGEVCQKCSVASICNGTYRTAFEYFGNTIIKPY